MGKQSSAQIVMFQKKMSEMENIKKLNKHISVFFFLNFMPNNNAFCAAFIVFRLVSFLSNKEFIERD